MATVDKKANLPGKLLLPLLALACSACAATAAPAPGPEVPHGTPPAITAPAAPLDAAAFVVDGTVHEEWMPLLKPFAVDPFKSKLFTPPPGLAPLPATCGAYATRRGEGKASCADQAAALAALDEALGKPGAEQRDAALVDLDGCAGLQAGTARALRAELAPVECAEAIVEPFLKAPPPATNGMIYGAMLGQAIASRLARTAHDPPTLPLPHDKARVLEFVKGPMRAWLEQQALAIESISQAATELPYYGKGIAAVEAGVADLRLVEAVRGGPIPDEYKKDEELKNVYYGNLDQLLDPRKDRGRDAALVGLRELALVGVIRDARVDRARTMLSRLYGGRRIDALDALLLPALPPAAPISQEERLAARLPTFYADLLLDEHAASRAGTLRQLLDRGVPLTQRGALRKAQLTPEVAALFARARLELGRLYWRAVDFDQAASLATAARPEATFSLALALALRGGPEDATDMMRKAPHALPTAHTRALDALAAAGGPEAGLAAFDGALSTSSARPRAPARPTGTRWPSASTRRPSCSRTRRGAPTPRIAPAARRRWRRPFLRRRSDASGNGSPLLTVLRTLRSRVPDSGPLNVVVDLLTQRGGGLLFTAPVRRRRRMRTASASLDVRVARAMRFLRGV